MKRFKALPIILAIAVFSVFAFLPLTGCSKKNETYYTVTFDSNGGSAVASVSVRSGDTVERPEDPTRDGCTFSDWFMDKGFAMRWDFETEKVIADTTLYAKWLNSDGTVADNDFDGDKNDDDGEEKPDDGEAQNYRVTFNVGREARLEGVSNPPSVEVAPGGKVTAPDVTRDGYTATWKKEGVTAWNFAENTVTGNMTLFAEWSGGTSANYSTLYLHYLREDADYESWRVYVWNNAQDGLKEMFYDYEPNLTDAESGAVYEIKLSDVGLQAASGTMINFLLMHKDSPVDDWIKDGGDNIVKLSNTGKSGEGCHWYIKQGHTSEGSATFGGSSGGGSGLRESAADVDRAAVKAAYPNPAPTATGWDEVGVGYQIFVASFCDSNGDGVGDIKGITSKLDYLAGLNVDVLWLTPVQSSNSYHGYDCYDYYSIDPKFGTNADYRELVYKAHKKGIKIIMDLVINHTSNQNEWFIKSKNAVTETVTHQDGTKETVNYRDFYRWKKGNGATRYYDTGDGYMYYSSFDRSMPELNYDCKAVRNSMLDVAMYWMAYGLDGFRTDAVKHLFMWEESENLDSDVKTGSGLYEVNQTKNVEFLNEFNTRLKAKYKNALFLGENWDGDTRAVAPFYRGMDSLFDFSIYYDLTKTLNGTEGRTPSSMATAFTVNDERYQEARGENNRPINSMFSSNHDVNRRMSELNSEEKAKLYFAVEMTLPGIGWIYYGDEIGLKDSGGGDNAHRQSMKWDNSYSNSCSIIGKGGGSADGAAEQDKDSASLLSYVKALCKLRNDYPALVSGNATYSEEDGIIKIVATKSGQKTVTVYHNFNNSVRTVSQSGTVVFGSATVGAYSTVAFIS